MDKKVSIHYDRTGDILHIDLRPAYAAQECEEIGDEILARLNPQTNAIENLEILFFSKCLLAGKISFIILIYNIVDCPNKLHREYLDRLTKFWYQIKT